METTATPAMLPHLWKATLASGVLALVLGGLVFWRPAAAIFVTAIFFGAYLLITGISQVALAFSVRNSVAGRVLLFISGAAALALAVLCFLSIEDSIDLLAIWIGVGFIFRGVATAMSAISDPTMPGRVWEIIVGVISLIAGIVMFTAPLQSLLVLTQVTGIMLVAIGVIEIVTAFGIKKASTAASV